MRYFYTQENDCNRYEYVIKSETLESAIDEMYKAWDYLTFSEKQKTVFNLCQWTSERYDLDYALDLLYSNNASDDIDNICDLIDKSTENPLFEISKDCNYR